MWTQFGLLLSIIMKHMQTKCDLTNDLRFIDEPAPPPYNQHESTLSADYGKDLSGCTTAENATLDQYGAAMRKSISTAMQSTPHHSASAGCFVSACIIHVQVCPR